MSSLLIRSLLISASVLGILQLTHCNYGCSFDAMTPQCNFRKVLNRRKRHLVIPKSTNFVLTVTGLKAIQLDVPKNWNLDLEFDMIWPIIPAEIMKKSNDKKTTTNKLNKNIRKKMYYYNLRRQKRDFYDTFEMAISRLGLPGKNCVLRTICEAKTFLHPRGISFIDDLLRVVLSHDEYIDEFDDYDFAYKVEEDCEKMFYCPLSLLQLLLNYNYY